MTALKTRALRVFLWIFAGIGLLYVGVMAYFTLYASKVMCEVKKQSVAISPDGFYVAKFEQLLCPRDVEKSGGPVLSGGTVLIGKASEPTRGTHVLHVPLTTTDVNMTWQGPRKLLITVPEGTSTSGLNSEPYGDDVIVALRTSNQSAPSFSERAPVGRSVSFASLRRQEDFKNWLSSNRIPFLIEMIGDKEFVIWDDRDTEQVLRWEHLGDENAGVELVQRVSDSKSGRVP